MRIVWKGLLATLLAGCAALPEQPGTTTVSTTGSTLVRTGQVIDVRDVTTARNQHSGAGAVIGGVLGGLAGSQIGKGNGRTLATVGGAVAGGLAGKKIAESTGRQTVTLVTVRFAEGDSADYEVEPASGFKVGEKVQVTVNGGETRVTR